MSKTLTVLAASFGLAISVGVITAVTIWSKNREAERIAANAAHTRAVWESDAVGKRFDKYRQEQAEEEAVVKTMHYKFKENSYWEQRINEIQYKGHSYIYLSTQSSLEHAAHCACHTNKPTSTLP